MTYSVEDIETFENLPDWIQECKDNLWGSSGREVVWAVVGNKSDLDDEVCIERIEDLCDTLETNLHFSLSAKTGDNVEKAFKQIIESLHEHKLRLSNSSNKQTNNSFVLGKDHHTEGHRPCCTTERN